MFKKIELKCYVHIHVLRAHQVGLGKKWLCKNSKIRYSLRPILLFAYTDASITKICLDTSRLAKSIMGWREY
jgi:hypothetical protein